jgi:hypothetical protein
MSFIKILHSVQQMITGQILRMEHGSLTLVILGCFYTQFMITFQTFIEKIFGELFTWMNQDWRLHINLITFSREIVQ